jgi:hypothetical protein
MENKFIRILDIDTNDAVNNRINLNLEPDKTKILRFQPYEILTDKFLKTLIQNNIPVITCLVFYKPAHYIEKIAHVDLKVSTMIQTHALNLITYGHDSDMVWFEKPLQNTYPDVTYADSATPAWTNVKTPYIAYDRNECKEIYRYSLPINKLTMVNVSIPHSIDTKQSARLCISLRTGLIFKNWEDACRRFDSTAT